MVPGERSTASDRKNNKNLIVYDMKKSAAAVFLIVCSFSMIFAQAPPQAFSLKACIKGRDGQPIVSRTIYLRITILQDSPDGVEVYSETFTATTNNIGQVDVEIGRGTPVIGEFSSIDWSAAEYFLRIEADTDPEKKCGYRVISVAQLLSVPYALYAGEAKNSFSGDYNDLINAPVIPANVSQLINDAGYITVETDGSVTNELQTLSIRNDTIFLSHGGFVKLPATSPSGGQYYYLDKDNDGFGDVYSPVWVPTGVNEPAHYITDSMDCNDLDPESHPGGTEIMGDGIDQDCNGTDLSINANWKPGDPWIDPQDGYAYKTVQIGDQVWMAENLRVQKYNDGTPIAFLQNNEWIDDTQGAYCSYIAPQIFGNLYNWYAVNTDRLCPMEWHVPEEAEWIILTSYLGGNEVAGGKVKEVGSAHWHTPNAASNSSGFTAFGAGWRIIDGSFTGFLDAAFFWTATQADAGLAQIYLLKNSSTAAEKKKVAKFYGLSVRCLKD
jgi:uncharacterized protein (TIGR02145 family)